MHADPMDAERSVLVLVDYQGRLMPAIDGGARVVEQGVRLGRAAQVLGVPVIGTEQNPRGLGPNDAAIAALCGRTLAKMHFDACVDGLLDAVHTARAPGPTDVVVAGCEAHVCLLQTALGLLRAGLRVWVPADACGSRLASSHALAMQRLREAGATVVNVEMVAFEWLHGCGHARFREVLPLLKAP
ncbi:MAG: isochorismatase family protein [Rubrivivax sp.]